MSDLRVSRIIQVNSDKPGISDGDEFYTGQSLPDPWQDGDCITVSPSTGEPIHLFADPDAGPDCFSYKPNSFSTWTIEVQKAGVNERGEHKLRVMFNETQNDLVRMDKERRR